ncbi:hypothetical protein JMUB7504_27330 [Staphylococcus aureus]
MTESIHKSPHPVGGVTAGLSTNPPLMVADIGLYFTNIAPIGDAQD